MKNEFKKTVYESEFADMIRILKNSDEWKKSNGKTFVFDGIVNTETYTTQHLKILVILSEPYSDREWDAVLQNQIDDKIHLNNLKKVPAVKNIAKLISAIFESLATENKSVLPNIDFGIETMLSNFKKVAWINIKKTSRIGSSSQNYIEILKHAATNQDLLRRQIKSIAPDLILICGNAAIDSVLKFNLLNAGRDLPFEAVREVNSQKIICLHHPSARGKQTWTNEKILSLTKEICSTFC